MSVGTAAIQSCGSGASKSGRTAIVLAAGILAALGGGYLQAISPRWSVVVVAGIVLATLAFCKMEAAIFVYTMTAFMVVGPFFSVTGRFGHEEGLFTSQLMLGLLAGVWATGLLLRALRDKRVIWHRSPIDKPLLGFIIAAVFSLVAAQFTWDYRVSTGHRYYITQVAELGLICMPITAYMLVSQSLRDMRWIKATYIAILAVGAIWLLLACPWFRTQTWVSIRWGPLLSIPLVSYLYAYVILRGRFDLKLLVAGFCLMVCLLLSIRFSGRSWMVLWASMAVSIFVMSWLRSKALFAAILCAGLVFLALKPDIPSSVLATERASSSLERLGIWASCIRIVMRRPLWGIGPDNFYPYYSHYYANVFQTLSVTSPHSNYFQVLVQYGILGLGALLWFICTCCRMLVRFYREASGEWEKVAFLAASGVFGGIATGACLADYLFTARANGGLANFSTTVYTWLLLGVVVSLRRALASGNSVLKQNIGRVRK